MALRYYIPTRPELRAIARQYLDATADGGAFPGPDEPDPDVLALADAPFEGAADVHDRLTSLEALFRERGDRRSVFLTIYARMTAAVREGIEGGYFVDGAWVRSYLVTFADYYRRALAAFERGEAAAVPPSWRIAFGASRGGGTLLLQDALLGINAHINDDLAFTVRDVSIDPDRPAKRADHDAINGILRDMIDDAQAALATVYDAATIGYLDDLGGRADEAIAHLGLVESRDLAWRNAVLLTDARLPWMRRLVRWRVRTVAAGAARLVLGAPFDPTIASALREIEVEGAKSPIAAFREAFHER